MVTTYTFREYEIAEDVIKCAKWHKANHHSRQIIIDCLFAGLYMAKYKEFIPLDLLWAKNEEIDAELTQLAEEMANKIYRGEI